MPLNPIQTELIKLFVQQEVLSFGDFTLKSGRKAPYFVNTGKINSGSALGKLAKIYAEKIRELNLTEITSVFGPAYKGIPLAVSVSEALSVILERPIGYTFDRKEVKAHGDGGAIVGHPLHPGDRIVLVEDVITAGTTLRHIVPILRDTYDVQIESVVIAVNRSEKGTGLNSAVKELEEMLDLSIAPIVNAYEILEYLSKPNESGRTLTQAEKDSFQSYLSEYGGKE